MGTKGRSKRQNVKTSKRQERVKEKPSRGLQPARSDGGSRTKTTRFLGFVALAALGAYGIACQSSSRPLSPQPPAVVTEPAATIDESPPRPPSNEPIRIPDHLDDEERWLVVGAVKPGAAGAWATGDFDEERNKLIIKERDVERFSIDTSKIAINWERLVILGINGRNSELRKRDFTVYHFARDQHGQWIVLER